MSFNTTDQQRRESLSTDAQQERYMCVCVLLAILSKRLEICVSTNKIVETGMEWTGEQSTDLIPKFPSSFVDF